MRKASALLFTLEKRPLMASLPIERAYGTANRGALLHSLDLALLLLLGCYLVFYLAFRPLGIAALLIVVLGAVVLTVRHRLLYNFPALFVLLGLSSIYLVLSLLDFMPSAWTRYREPFAAVRQWVWLPFTFPLVGAFVLFFRVFGMQCIRYAIPLLIAIYVMARIILLPILPYQLEGSQFTLYAITNDGLLLFLFAFLALATSAKNHLQFFLIFAALLAMAGSGQGYVVVILFGAIVMFPRFAAHIVYAYLLVLLAILVVAPMFIAELAEFDQNTAVRAIFWRDVAVAVHDTDYTGVGFGTEYITNRFTDLGREDWAITSDRAEDRLYISSHSLFYDLALRMGPLGVVLFLAFIFQLMRIIHRRADKRNVLPFGGMAIFLTINAVNPGMISILYLFASCAALGFIIWSSGLRSVPARRASESL